MWGTTLLQKGFPHKSRRHSQIYGKREAVKSKIKSAISRKSDKNKQVLKSSRHNGNKEIADFNLRKSAAIFANELRECSQIAKAGKFHGREQVPYNHWHCETRRDLRRKRREQAPRPTLDLYCSGAFVNEFVQKNPPPRVWHFSLICHYAVTSQY